MTDERFIGVLCLLIVSALVIGFIIGWCANPSDGHD
jgi:hypothetical protein